MKKLLLLLAAILPLSLTSCRNTGGFTDKLFIGYTGDGVEITGLEGGDLTGAGYNLKTKKAYLRYLDGRTVNLKITGAGLGKNQLALYLEGGGKILVDLKTARVTSGTVPGAEPPLPQ